MHVIQAVAEADPVLAVIARSGAVDAVISDDSDMTFGYGCPHVRLSNLRFIIIVIVVVCVF